jgi:hypothetical protein
MKEKEEQELLEEEEMEEEEESGMPIPVVLKNLEDEKDKDRVGKTKVIRREQVNLDNIMEESGTKFYVTGDTVKIGFRELLYLADRHDLDQVLDLEKEDVVISAKLLAGIARSDLVEEEEEELQYIDAAAVGLFIAGFLVGIIGILVSDISHVHTAAWVIFFVCTAMLISYIYQGIRTGFIKRFWKKYLQKIAKED